MDPAKSDGNSQLSDLEEWELSVSMARLNRILDDGEKVSDEQANANLAKLYKAVPVVTEERQIRLLTSHPSSLSGYVECTLKSASLDAVPEYEALSYTWGGTSPSVIKVNDILVRISNELEQTLCLLQQRNSSRTLWIDAICIDQKNIPEKNEQVAFMRTIYQSASRTIVWLGNNNPFESGSADRSSERDGEAAMRLIEDWNVKLKANDDTSEMSPDYGELHNAFSTIVSLRWWRRIWVVQEVTVSKEVRVGYGRSWTDWAPFVAYSEWIRKNRTTPWHSEMTTFHQMVDISTKFKAGEVVTLHELLRLTAVFDATDARDKVFALLGLATDEDRKAIVPDYSAELSSLYTKVVRHIIENEQSLSVLALAGSYSTQDTPTQDFNGREINFYEGMQQNLFHGTKTSVIQRKPATALKDMPSWVTDFRSASYTRARMRYPLEQTYNASLSRKPIVHFTPNNTLSIQAIWFGKVGGIISTQAPSPAGIDIVQLSMNTPPPHLDFAEKMAAAALAYHVPAHDARSELKKSKDDLWRTLILNRGHKGSIPASKDFGLMYETIRGRAVLPPDFSPNYLLTPGSPSDPERQQFSNALFMRNTIFAAQFPDVWTPPPPGTLEYVHNSFFAREDRTLFMTCAGGMGMGPRDVKRDDVLVVALGCGVPLVLRRDETRDGKWRLVGECFVMGVMEGEVVRILEEGRERRWPFVVETFEIR